MKTGRKQNHRSVLDVMCAQKARTFFSTFHWEVKQPETTITPDWNPAPAHPGFRSNHK